MAPKKASCKKRADAHRGSEAWVPEGRVSGRGITVTGRVFLGGLTCRRRTSRESTEWAADLAIMLSWER